MAITAEFSVSSIVGDNFHTCIFTDASIGVVTSRKWIFGDGEVSEGNDVQVTHLYRQPGVYTVTLVAGNSTEQGSIVKEDLIVVNEVKPEPCFIIMQSFNQSNGRFWKFYLDSAMYLHFENNNYLFVSRYPAVDVGRWTLLEFHPETMKFIVGSYLNYREEIDAVFTAVASPYTAQVTLTEILPQSAMRIDELKILSRDEDLQSYYEAYRPKAAFLDNLP